MKQIDRHTDLAAHCTDCGYAPLDFRRVPLSSGTKDAIFDCPVYGRIAAGCTRGIICTNDCNKLIF